MTEAGRNSGALITADYAKIQGRPVFAVPGPITSQGSRGTSALLKNGAMLVQDVYDILNYFSIQKKFQGQKRNTKLSKQEQAVISTLEQEQMHVDLISKKTGMKTAELSTILSALELKGLVRNLDGGMFERIN